MDKNTLEAISQCWSISPSGQFDFEKAERLIQENYISPDLEDVLEENKKWAESLKALDERNKTLEGEIQKLKDENSVLMSDRDQLKDRIKVFEAKPPLLESKVETAPRGKSHERKGDTKSTPEE